MKNIIFFSVVILITLSGCAGSPVHTAKLDSVEIKSISDRHLCIAYNRISYRTGVVRSEVERRGVDCNQYLSQLEKLKIKPPTGNCEGIEFMGVYGTSEVYGMRFLAARVRNNSSVSREVGVVFKLYGEKIQTTSGIVAAGQIENIDIGGITDHEPELVKISYCK